MIQVWSMLLVGRFSVVAAANEIQSSSIVGWLSEFLYFPEVLYLVILVWLFLSGPGWISVDYLITSRSRA